MELIKKLQNLAKKNQVKIGIGVGPGKEAHKIMQNSIAKSNELGYGEIIEFDDPVRLIRALESGEIACALRGNLSAKETITELKHTFKITSLYRSALICIDEKYSFFLAPVGIDEGIFIDERFKLIKLINSLLQPLDVTADIAIISGGRPMEDLGRSGLVDESLRAGEKLLELVKEEKMNVKHYGVLIEDAFKESNVIIAPNGIVGNLLFRTLHYLGNCNSYGAPILNLDKTFIDTSRNKQDYTGSIMLASALSR